MKFGRRLLEESDPRFRHFYIAYKNLKQAIKLITGSDGSTFSIQQVTHNFGNLPALAGSVFRPPESRFQELLNHEKQKINKFTEVNLTATTSALKQLLKDLLREDMTDEGYVEDMSVALAEVDRQSEMLVFLKNYQSLNWTGFRKITKKYDKHNHSQSAQWFMAQLQKEAFVNADLDGPLKLLSLCYQIVLARSEDTFGKESLLSGSINLVSIEKLESGKELVSGSRETVTYLIRGSDVMRVKVMLAKCLSLASIGSSCFIGREAIDVLINPLASLQPACTSSSEKISHGCLYLDNRQFDIIRGVLNVTRRQLQNTRLTRIRWFGLMDGENDKDVYIERIPLSELHGYHPETQNLIDLSSNHLRTDSPQTCVMIKYKHVCSMLANTFDVESWMRRKGYEKDQEVRELLQSTQQSLSSGDLLPVLQTWSLRTSFSLVCEQQNIVEAHVDENLHAVAELQTRDGRLVFPEQGVAQTGGLITPYTKVRSDGDFVQDDFVTLNMSFPKNFRFPYQVNRPKSELAEGETTLFENTVDDLSMEDLKSCLEHFAVMHNAHDFTPLAHAAATLFKETKPHKLHTPGWFSSNLVVNLEDGSEQEEKKKPETDTRGAEPVSEERAPRANNSISSQKISGLYCDLAGQAAPPVAPGSQGLPIELLPAPRYLDQPPPGNGGGFLNLDATSIQVQGDPLQQPLVEHPAVPAARTVQNGWLRKVVQLFYKAPSGSTAPKTSASVRVEPKTFFANERTLLQWMNIAVLLSTISITLMTFGSLSSRIAGFVLAPIAVYFIIHSYNVYLYRTNALMNKEPIDYVDHTGPAVLVCSLVFAMAAIVLMNIFQSTAVSNHSALPLPTIRLPPAAPGSH
ncbi:SPX domain protein [Gregarina niphandrodes]|uniref:SPX domain protein n=1 Tax=Gregarina niphandrodes TaxID=110365 RepID=A0A023B1S9_GRENI|nr:SPX domain protein [Gregarina niphandrodes]EZG47613.1 SPX domain protein [Gregarina niphandrodes]|eukprot:XP_011132163.1 SPX domain protein [Gregarina niphandrodes]